jgi:hypothetical protein
MTTLLDIDPLYVILAFVFVAVGIVIYLRSSHEAKIKRTVAAKYDLTEKLAPKAAPAPEMPPPDVVKDKAARLSDLKKALVAGDLSQIDYDTAKIRIMFER